MVLYKTGLFSSYNLKINDHRITNIKGKVDIDRIFCLRNLLRKAKCEKEYFSSDSDSATEVLTAEVGNFSKAVIIITLVIQPTSQ